MTVRILESVLLSLYTIIWYSSGELMNVGSMMIQKVFQEAPSQPIPFFVCAVGSLTCSLLIMLSRVVAKLHENQLVERNTFCVVFTLCMVIADVGLRLVVSRYDTAYGKWNMWQVSIVLSLLTTLLVEVTQMKKKRTEECFICAGYVDDVVHLPCGHQIHTNCLMKWWETTKMQQCPLCRYILYEDREDERIAEDRV
jgi:hypothetical protein